LNKQPKLTGAMNHFMQDCWRDTIETPRKGTRENAALNDIV